MAKFHVRANACDFGVIEATDEQNARDLAAEMAGYKSEEDMTKQIGQASEIVAVAVPASPFELVFIGELPLSVEVAFADEFDRGIRRDHDTYEAAEKEAYAVLAQRPEDNWRPAHPAIIYGPGLGDGRTIR